MEQIVKVRSLLPDGKARVVHVRQSACSGDCHKCAGCGAAEETLERTAENPVGAAPGDVVILESASAPVLRGAAVLYVLPEAMRGLQDYRMILYAIVLILVMLFTWSPKVKEFMSVIADKVSGVFKKKEAGTNE